MASIQLLRACHAAHGAAADAARAARHAATEAAANGAAQSASEATGLGQGTQPEDGGDRRRFTNASRIHVDLQLWPRQYAAFTRYNDRADGFLPYAASQQRMAVRACLSGGRAPAPARSADRLPPHRLRRRHRERRNTAA